MVITEHYFLGIDAGGSSTKAALTDAAGTVLARAQVGPGNLRAGAEPVYAALCAVADAAIRPRFREINTKTSVFCAAGFAGFSSSEALAALKAKPFPFRAMHFTSDADIACIGAHAGRDGAIVIAGTGSIGYARLAEKSVRIGGYGFPISDEGGGAEIGFQALKAFLQVRDGRRVADALSARLAPMIDEQGAHWWRDHAAPKDFAALTPHVFAAAQAGDACARAILTNAGAEISKIALALCERGASAWCFMGGLAAPLTPFLTEPAQLKRIEPEGDGVDGALWLARQLA